MLFEDQKRHSISLPSTYQDGKPSDIAFLTKYICEQVMKDTRKELFVLDDHVYVKIGLPIVPPDCRSLSPLPSKHYYPLSHDIRPLPMIFYPSNFSRYSINVPYSRKRTLQPIH